jgi:predicted glycoside hydrolase/deacetylase ChbG (UPF0249 family)
MREWPRRLIVNADDFGLSPGVNRGVIEAHEHGIVTSTSLMVRWPAAVEAAAYARSHPDLSAGLHLDLAEWIVREGEWEPIYEVVPKGDSRAAEEEIQRQLEAFRRLVGREPTHLDSHQHAHVEEPAQTIVQTYARELGVPVRHHGPARYCGDFYGQGRHGTPYPHLITVGHLVEILASLPEGTTELGCHPGYPDGFESNYVEERATEVRVLCDPRVREAIAENDIELTSFASLTARRFS